MVEPRTPPNMIGQPRVEFRQTDFEALLYSKGYEVQHERAVLCPCKVKAGDNLVDCKNCLGTGWIFVDAVQTRMLLQSINKDVRYMPWSPELAGTIRVTARYVDELAYMDRITALGTLGRTTQVLHPYQDDANTRIHSYLYYSVDTIEKVYRFIDSNTALELVDPANYSLSAENDSVILFDYTTFRDIQDLTFSILYKHPIQFHVIDLDHEMRKSQVIEANEYQEIQLPNSAIARRSHYVLDRDNITGDLVLDNG